MTRAAWHPIVALGLALTGCGPNDVGDRIARDCADSQDFDDCYQRQWEEHLEDMLHPKQPLPGGAYP
jgi:hypothetical protein